MKKNILLLVLLILATGCNTIPPRKHAYIQPANNNAMPLKTFILLQQDGIAASVPYGNNATIAISAVAVGIIPGLLGGLIDSRTHQLNLEKAEKRLAPIRTGLEDFRPYEIIEQTAAEIVGRSESVALSQPKIVDSYEAIDALTNPTESYLIVALNYVLTADFKTLIVSASASVKSGPSAEKGMPTYSNAFTYIGETLQIPTLSEEEKEALINKIKTEFSEKSYAYRKDIGKKKEYKANLKAARKGEKRPDKIMEKHSNMWSTSHNQILRQDLNSGFNTLLELVIADINDPTTAEQYATTAIHMKKNNCGYPKSTLVAETDTRVAVRSAVGFSSGAICSVTKE